MFSERNIRSSFCHELYLLHAHVVRNGLNRMHEVGGISSSTLLFDCVYHPTPTPPPPPPLSQTITFYVTYSYLVIIVICLPRTPCWKKLFSCEPYWILKKDLYMYMVKSSNGNIFSVTGLLCGEFTGHRWIPLTEASDAELSYFLLQTVK